MKKLYTYFLLCIVLLLLPLNYLFSQSEKKSGRVLFFSEEINYEVAPFTSILEDKTNSLTYEEIKQKEFTLNDKANINFGIKSSITWIKFRIKNQTSIPTAKLFFVIEYPQLDLVCFYFVLKDGSIFKKNIGDTFPFYDRELKIRFLNISLPEELNYDSDIYISVQSTSASIVPLYLGTEKSIREKDHYLQMFSGSYFGVLVIMILYNLFIFTSLRDKVFLYYVLFTFFVLLYIATFMGYGYEYIWPNFPFIQSRLIYLTGLTMVFSVILFSITFLDTKLYSPGIHKFYKYTLSIYPLIFIYLTFAPSLIANRIISGLGFVSSILLPLTGFYVWRKGNKVARLFLIAWLPFFIAINFFILRIFGFIEKLGMEIIYITQLANALEAVIFSFALADKVNILKEQVRANLEKSNFELELKVKERTGELNNTLSLIRQDLNFAKKIQTRLLPGQAFQVENLKIVSRYIPMDEVGGDFFDIAKLDNNIVRILIADATGHGVQGALVTMLIKSEYEVLKESYTSTSLLMKRLNHLFFTKYNNLYSFFTCFIVDIDVDNEIITYTSAGHSGQLLISGNDLKVLERTGKIPGVMKEADFQEVKMRFQHGDKLLLFTDGIFEEFNKKEEEYGEEKLHQSVKTIATEKIDIILDECLKKMSAFLGNEPQQDDITLIGVEWN